MHGMNVWQKCVFMIKWVWEKAAKTKCRKNFLSYEGRYKLVTHGEERFHTKLSWTIVSKQVTELLVGLKLQSSINTENNLMYTWWLSKTFCIFSAFVAFSTMPELARKIKLYFALAPVTAIKYASSPVTKLLHLPEKILWVCDILVSTV